MHVFVTRTAVIAMHSTSQQSWWCKSILALQLHPEARMFSNPNTGFLLQKVESSKVTPWAKVELED